ncbi:MAG: MBL fold metallo-hydrolase [Pseudopedobacter saltans]|uniref:MBL fold metallo-hydrolase n=1 Tax=Pseudopedobacter saltans TaxID=151895 RepID=A0A2W5GXM1_9SPHI|nr:MAG: MBL fold metallo-hydrolase [Pseudopedobacter saltans]
MKIAFHGAARTVTGSKHLVSLKNGTQFLFDCGMFQGMGAETDQLNENFGFDPSPIQYLFLSHAHIDHCGLIPRLVKKGFHGRIFCTSGTRDLAEIMLKDSAKIQMDDAAFLRKRSAKKNISIYKEPLYDLDDVRAALDLFEIVNYNTWITIQNGLEVYYADAGHIIGSTSVHVRVTEEGKTKQISFSGDVGRYKDIILKSPQTFPQADYILIESTYGNSLHEDVFNSPDELLGWITKTCIDKKGKLIIPSFSVGRTQELLYFLNQLSLEKQLPNLPVYVDSPLSLEATEVTKKHSEGFNKKIQNLLKVDDDPFDFPGLSFIESVEESKTLNSNDNPMIIISASGMADAGRVKHHIYNNIEDAKNTILIVGYCEPNSLGGRLMRGAEVVRIFNDEMQVKAEVGVMRSMSAHGDYDDLCQFLACQNPDLVHKLFLVHGEYEVQQDFQRSLLKKGFKDVQIPALHQEFGL